MYVEDKSGTAPSNHAASFSVTTQGHTISWKTGNIVQERVSVGRCDKDYLKYRTSVQMSFSTWCTGGHVFNIVQVASN